MATTALASSASRTANAFRLTKAHLLAAFAPLAETQDLTHRNSFFERHVHPEVRWTVAGGAHSLVGTRIGPAEHSKATFEKCGTSTSPFLHSSVEHSQDRVSGGGGLSSSSIRVDPGTDNASR